MAAHNALKTHVLSHLAANGVQEYPAIKAASPAIPSVAIAHLVTEGHIAGNANEGWGVTPQGQKHLESVTGNSAPPAETGSGGNAEEPVTPALLHPDHAALFQHVAIHPPQGLNALADAGHSVTTQNQAYMAGHLQHVGQENGWATYGLTPEGQKALAGHQAALAGATGAGEAAPPPVSIPEGLTPGQEAMYKHIQANPGRDFEGAMNAYHQSLGTVVGSSAAMKGLTDAGHVTENMGNGYHVAANAASGEPTDSANPPANSSANVPANVIPPGLTRGQQAVYKHI